METKTVNQIGEKFIPNEYTFSYDGNENETYYIFIEEKGKDNKRVFAEVFAAEDIAHHMVELLNKSDINETISCF